ncbi:hemin uptake protein HemP [Magnetospirillum molischianum]|nr:hemin uptake protein HemP [Magnetospirillum molischianum]
MSCLLGNADRQRIRCDILLLNRRDIIIEHDGSDYVLRVTRQNKLILTK